MKEGRQVFVAIRRRDNPASLIVRKKLLFFRPRVLRYRALVSARVLTYVLTQQRNSRLPINYRSGYFRCKRLKMKARKNPYLFTSLRVTFLDRPDFLFSRVASYKFSGQRTNKNVSRQLSITPNDPSFRDGLRPERNLSFSLS